MVGSTIQLLQDRDELRDDKEEWDDREEDIRIENSRAMKRRLEKWEKL